MLKRRHWYLSPCGQQNSQPIAVVPPKKENTSCWIRILIKCYGKGEGKVGTSLLGHSHFLLKTFPTLVLGQSLFLRNSYPLWLGNEVSGYCAQHHTWQFAKDWTTPSNVWHWFKVPSERAKCIDYTSASKARICYHCVNKTQRTDWWRHGYKRRLHQGKVVDSNSTVTTHYREQVTRRI